VTMPPPRGRRTGPVALVVSLVMLGSLLAGVVGVAWLVQTRIGAVIERVDDPVAGLEQRPATLAGGG
jgi:hypothetical protein